MLSFSNPSEKANAAQRNSQTAQTGKEAAEKVGKKAKAAEREQRNLRESTPKKEEDRHSRSHPVGDPHPQTNR
ncbi:MAG: hypothetical protein ACI3XE_04995, partial [Eubacteriales bacterium]